MYNLYTFKHVSHTINFFGRILFIYISLNKSMKMLSKILYLPDDSNSGETSSDKSGSSPYQKIHNSLAAARLSGGCCTLCEADVTVGCNDVSESNKPPPAPLLADGGGGGGGVATRRQTHKMSLARQRE